MLSGCVFVKMKRAAVEIFNFKVNPKVYTNADEYGCNQKRRHQTRSV